MADKKTLTFAIMDAPYESARSTTALRLVDIAARRGYHINVFAYEGAVGLAFTKQTPHANSVHGRDVEEEDHPLPHRWVAALLQEAEKNGGKLDWVNCGLCVDERGVNEAVEGTRRGTPADFWKFAQDSDNTLVIPTKWGETMKALNVIETAYRATIEEQDDTIVWINHAMKGAGADLAVLLRGNAVNYAVRAQDASGLSFGNVTQTQPPRLAEDLTALVDKGVTVYVVEDDVATRGLERHELVDGLRPIAQSDVAGLYDEFDQVWHW